MDGSTRPGCRWRCSPTTRPPSPSPPDVRWSVGGAAGRPLPARHLPTVDEAKHALLAAKHYYFFTPCHFVVADASGASFAWEHSPDEPGGDRRHGRRRASRLHQPPSSQCRTSHSCRRGRIARTAALTYHRWRTLSAATAERESYNAMTSARSSSRCGSCTVEGARTFWHAAVRRGCRVMEVSFYLYDREGQHLLRPREFRLR